MGGTVSVFRLPQARSARLAFRTALVAAACFSPRVAAANAPAVAVSAVPPTNYHAICDARVYPKPPLPKLGPAGFTFRDPTFHCPILRISDEKTTEGRSIVTPATGFTNPWNADATIFCVLADGAMNVPYRFDPKTMAATRIPGIPMLPNIANEVAFSRHDPNICFGKDRQRRGIAQFDFATGGLTDFIDVGALTGLEVGYLGTLSVGDNDVLAMIFGGPAQDASPYVFLYDRKTKKHRVWNTREGTIDGTRVPGAPLFTQHSGVLDNGGRFFVTLGPGVQGPIVWDTAQGLVYAVTAQKEGHYALGYGDMINYNHNWVHRSLDARLIDAATNLMYHPAGEPYFAYDSHESWCNARPGARLPVVLSTYHPLEAGDPQCAYGDEIVALASDGSGRIWRFAHHRSTVHKRSATRAESEANSYNFWDCPRGNVSPDGRFYLFTSNWEESVGRDPRGRVRDDAFVVKLESAQE